MKKYLIIAAITILVLQSCKPNGPHYKLYDETKEWCDFKEGTWWKYENEMTGEQDCLWVAKNNADRWMDYADDRIKESGDYINLIIKNTDTSKLYNMKLEAMEKGNFFIFLEREMFEDTAYVYYATLLAFNPEMLNLSDYLTESNILHKYETFSLNSFEFKKVIHVTCDITKPSYYDPLGKRYDTTNEYWIAKYEGIIKKITRTPYDTSVWVLQNYNIIKQ